MAPATTAASEKRCYYEVLGLSRDCSADAIRTAYKKLALQRHPDKLIQSGVSEAEATSQFQELVQAYETLSDPKQRSYYDSHRTQILFANPSSSNNSFTCVPDLSEYFSTSVYRGYGDGKRGFYRVYGEVFRRIYDCEIGFVRKVGLNVGIVKEMPLIGGLDSEYDQVSAFYGYWLGFTTVMDFCWVDQYDVMAGVNRKMRRVMEDENNKLRKLARREYNDTVRRLAEFVKKRDKRVVDMIRKKEEERRRKIEAENERRKQAKKEKLERMRGFTRDMGEEEEEEEGEEVAGWEEEEDDMKKKEERKEFYCVVCGKKFKSEKQWKNHEQSKKHKEKVAELRESFADEDEEYQDVVEHMKGDDVKVNDKGFVDGDGDFEELNERFEENVVLEDEKDEDVHKDNMSSEEEEDVENSYFDSNDSIEAGGFSGLAGLTEEKVPIDEIHVEDNGDEFDYMQCNKKAPKNRKARRAKSKKNCREGMKINDDGVGLRDEGIFRASDVPTKDSIAHSHQEEEDDQFVNTYRTSSQMGDRKNASKKETKLKNSSKGKKTKASSKNTNNECEKCGQDFESRNKLHRHLEETGHSSLKHK